MKTIKAGSSGKEVRIAQLLLNAKDKASFDTAFADTVKAYQKLHSLAIDGTIGAKTWAVIAANAPTVRNMSSPVAATKAVQIILDMDEKNIDGKCGTKTRAQIVAYQAAAGLAADGICGAKTWTKMLDADVVTVAAAPKVLNDCKMYLQWDSRWKNIKYSTHTTKQTIGNSGCGPTSMAMILAAWQKSNISPVDTCSLAVEHGFRTASNGTAWGFFKFCFEHYAEFSKFVQTSSIATLQAAIREGALAVCSMNNGDNNFWTTGGHYIVVRGVDSTHIYANDPNKSAYPRKQSITKFKGCMKQAFIFWP